MRARAQSIVIKYKSCCFAFDSEFASTLNYVIISWFWT